MELLGGSPVPAVEFGSRTLSNTTSSSSTAFMVNSPQQSQTYASLSNSTSASTRMDMRVYAGKYRNTLIESITHIICRVELETIQFRGDENTEDREYLKASRSQMGEEAAAAERELSQRERGAAADARLQRQRDRASAANGFTSQLEGVGSPNNNNRKGTASSTPTSGDSSSTTTTTYTLWLREIESVDVLADRVVLISSSNATNASSTSADNQQLAGGRNVTIYCNSDVTLAAAVGRVIKSRVDTAMQLHRLQQRRLLERDEELEEAGEALDGLATHRDGGGSGSSPHHHRHGSSRFDPSISLGGEMVMRGSGSSSPTTANYNMSHQQDGGGVVVGTRVVAVPTTSHSTSSLPLRNYTRAANSFNSLAAALKESNAADASSNPGEFERNLKSKLAAAYQMDDTRPQHHTGESNSPSSSKALNAGNVAGDFLSDDVLNPRHQQSSITSGGGRMVLDATASGHQKDYIRSSMVGNSSGLSRSGAMTNATVMAAPYSHYPALRSPFQTHPSPSQPYRAVAAEKSAAQQHHVNLLNDKREAERREGAARSQVEDLTKELRSMRSEISVLKTAHNARYGARGGGLSEMLKGFGISDGGADMDSSNGLTSPKTPTRGTNNTYSGGGGGGGGASRLNFDAILEPSIDVRILQHSASDTPEQTAAKKAAAELLLRADGGGGVSTSAAIQRVLSQGGVPTGYTNNGGGRGGFDTSPQQSHQYNQTLARSLAAGAKKRGSVMLEQLMVSNDGGGGFADSGLLSPNDPNLIGTPFDSARRTISHRADGRHRVRVQSPSDQYPLGGGGGGGVGDNNSGADSVSMTPKDSSSRLQRRSSSSGLLTRTLSSGKQPSPSTTDLVRKDSRNNSQFLPTTGAFSGDEDPLSQTQKPTAAVVAAAAATTPAPALAVTPPSVAPPAKKGVPPPPPKKSAPAAPPAAVVESNGSSSTPVAPAGGGPPPPKGVPPPPSKKAPPPPTANPAPQPAATPPASTSGGPSAPKGVPPPPPKKAPPAPKQPPPEPPAAQQSQPAAAAPASTNGGPPPPRGVAPPPPKKAAPKPPTEPI